MKKIYFAASIRGGREDREKYNKIINILKRNYIVLTEHIGLESLNENGMSDEEIYERDISWLNESDLVVCEASVPSLGVGYELSYAENKKIPVIILYDRTSVKKLSAMIRGDSYYKIIEYTTFEELVQIIEKI